MSGSETFHFLRPAWLLAIAALAPLLWLSLRQQAGSNAWRRVCDPQLLRHLALPGGGRGSRAPLALAALGWAAACLALAGPTWKRMPQPAWDEPVQTVFALSLAPSMNERDVAPSRLVRARYALLDALDRVEGAVGLVIYAQEPYAVTPLTDDPRVIAQQVSLLEPGLMPGRGTRLDRAIDEARVLIERAGAAHGRVLLLGDGLGDAPDEALAAAERSAAAGFPVSVLGVAGELEALESLAAAGGGRYAALRADGADLDYLLAASPSALPLVPGSQRSDLKADVWNDAGAWLVLLPLLLAPLAFRRGWAAALCLVVFAALEAPPASAAAGGWWSRADQQGAWAFERSEPGAAAELFDDPAWRGVSQYKSRDFEGAVETLQGREDTLSQYNLGNALAQASRLEEAIAAYDQILERDPSHEDARFNRDLVQELLNQQQQDPQQEPQQESQQQQRQDEQQQQQDEQQREQQDPQQEPQQEGQQQQQQDEQQQQQDEQQQEQSQQQSSEGQSQEPQGQQQKSPPDEERDSGSMQGASDAHESEPQESAQEVRPEPESGEGDEQERGAPPASGTAREFSERDQEVEQWLNRVPDDPGGLLREKLRRRYAERRYGVQGGWR